MNRTFWIFGFFMILSFVTGGIGGYVVCDSLNQPDDELLKLKSEIIYNCDQRDSVNVRFWKHINSITREEEYKTAFGYSFTDASGMQGRFWNWIKLKK